ncbi:MAG: hypothetical protein AAF663_05560 [Planctomycetota bacterium]
MYENLVLIIAIYACIRLLGLALEARATWKSTASAALQLFVSLLGIVLIVLLTLEVSGIESHIPE